MEKNAQEAKAKRDADDQMGELEYNKTISDQQKHNPKYRQFLDWCFENGVKWTGVDFPAYFGNNGELRGIVTTRNIEPYEVILAVPNKLLITTLKAREDKYLSRILEAHREVFYDDDNGEYNTLIAYLIKERLKGKESFFYPFLAMIEDAETAVVWDKETIDFIEEPSLKQEALDAQHEFKEEWKVMKDILDKYPNMFPQ